MPWWGWVALCWLNSATLMAALVWLSDRRATRAEIARLLDKLRDDLIDEIRASKKKPKPVSGNK